MSKQILRDDFLKNQVLTDLKVDPTQSWAAVIVNQADVESNGYDESLWLLDLSDNHLIKPDLAGRIHRYRWQDGALVYMVTTDGSSSFYRHNLHTNISKLLFSLPLTVSEWVFCGAKLFFTSTYSLLERSKYVQEGTELPFYAESLGVTADYRKILYSYRLSDGKITAITGDELSVTQLVADETGSRLIFISSSREQYLKNEMNLYLVQTESEQFELLTPKDTFRISHIGFRNTNTIIFAGTDLKAYGRNQNHELYTIELHSGHLQKLTVNFNQDPSGKSVSTDARFGQTDDFQFYRGNVFFVTLGETGCYLNKISPTGRYEQLTYEPGTIDSFAVLEDRVLLVGLRLQAWQEIYSVKNGVEQQLTKINVWLNECRTTGQPEPLRFINSAGMDINGWVIKPADFDAGQSYPGVLCIHGGPKMIYTSVYSHLMQLLAAQGYFVFFCNPQGSDGQGNQFADIRGDFGGAAFADLMQFTDRVIDRYPNLDASRLGVNGGSYGGYMTNYIITHTDRFQAAVSERGISNLVSMFNTSDIGYAYLGNYLEGADPWCNSEMYRENSPLAAANRVHTPTLFIHGKNDLRCNYTESLQMFSALRYFGIPAKICLFEGENHFLETKGKPLHKIKRFTEILQWFATYLQKAD